MGVESGGKILKDMDRLAAFREGLTTLVQMGRL